MLYSFIILVVFGSKESGTKIIYSGWLGDNWRETSNNRRKEWEVQGFDCIFDTMFRRGLISCRGNDQYVRAAVLPTCVYFARVSIAAFHFH